MTVSKKDILDRIIDLKNITVFGEWWKEVLEMSNKRHPNETQYQVDLEVRSLITDTFWFGFLCLPIGWTTEKPALLKSRLKNFDKFCKPLVKETDSKSMKEIKKETPQVLKILKRYYKFYIEAFTDSQWHGYRRFKNNKLTSGQKRKYLNNYLELLNSYEENKIPLWPTCKEIRLIIWSMFN